MSTIGDTPAPCIQLGCTWVGPVRDRRYGLCPEHAAQRTPEPATGDFRAEMERTRERFHAVGLGAEYEAAMSHHHAPAPATGEDVETVARIVWQTDVGGTDWAWGECPESIRARFITAAKRILAALDLPGRELALREEGLANVRAMDDLRMREIKELNRRIRDYEMWLRDWEDACPEEVCVESDGPQSLRVWAAAVVEERDAANAALADVARLLDEAREERDRLAALVGDENQPGWNDCSRADAIRQANDKHTALMHWIDEHDKRCAERDAARAEAKAAAELERQAWFYLARCRAEVAEEIAAAIERWASDFEDPADWEDPTIVANCLASLARQHATAGDAAAAEVGGDG